MEKKLIDLFSGCGGMSLGFQNAGFKILGAYDNWQPAIDIYTQNFSHPIHKRDLSDESIIEELREQHPDIIIGGPPCQDFSIAGGRDFEGKRANLTLSYGKIIYDVRPEWFVMENVYNIEKSPVFEKVLTIFKSAGYGITKKVWDASYMGVPQMRKRYFVIGKLGAQDDFLLDDLLKNLSDRPMTIRDYLGDKLGTDYYYMHPRSYARRAIFSIDEPSSTIRGVNRPMPASYKAHPADKTTNFALVKSLDTKERSYIQTFPESFKFCGGKSNIEQAIGNAVPVKMAEYVAKAIMSYIENDSESTTFGS
jgi:DNA (cytosine-5)-methyltransferase 1